MATDPKCKNCRFWDPEGAKLDLYWDDLRGWGWCQRIRHRRDDDFDPDDLATPQDYEDYKAVLRTRAEFGCVLFEEEANHGA